MLNRVSPWIWLCGLLLLLLVGCGRPTLIADDTIIMNGRPAPLNAYIGHKDLFNLRSNIRDTSIDFSAGGRQIGRDAVDENGRAFTVYEDPNASVGSFRAQARFGGRILESTGRVYHWRDSRVIVAVDVDYVIVRTNYVRLLFGKHIPVSPPFPHARDALVELAKDYQILYLTARPRPMMERTREWLEHYGFPRAPIVVSDRFHNVLHQLEWKRDALKQLHVQHPSLLVSIGNRQIDVESALNNQILPVTLQTVEHDVKPNAGDVLLQDWLSVREFFRVNRQTLINPGRLDAALQSGTALLQPVRDKSGQYQYETVRLGPDVAKITGTAAAQMR